MPGTRYSHTFLQEISMYFKTFASALAVSAAVLLAGCDAAVEKVAENTDDGKMRAEFVTSCTDSAVSAAGSNAAFSKEQFNQLCGCSFDEAAKLYPDATAWKKAVINYGLSQNDPELESKLTQAMGTCVQNMLQN